MGKKIGLILLVFMLCACGQKDNDRAKTSTEDETVDQLSEKLESWGIPSDSYIYDFLINEYAVEFDPVAYEEKLREQLPEDCVFIYDSQLYVEGTLNDMMHQYGNYFANSTTVDMDVTFLTYSEYESEIILFIGSGPGRRNVGLQIYLVETAEGLEVVYMRDYYWDESATLYSGYTLTNRNHFGNNDWYFTRVDENGDFILISNVHNSNIQDYYRTESHFENECMRYVMERGVDYYDFEANKIYVGEHNRHINFHLVLENKHTWETCHRINKNKCLLK